MSEGTNLYHCTNSEALLKILASGAFYPRFCLEKNNYWGEKEDRDYAYAMVCFADLLVSELPQHMERFHADSYICMKKDWAIRKGLSIVTYYNQGTIESLAFKKFIKVLEREYSQNGESDTFINLNGIISLLMMNRKKYEGYYYDKKRKCFSENITQFFTEREWRYIPLPKDDGANYILTEEYLNESFRKEKEDGLVAHGLVLRFTWDDIIEIGLSKEIVESLFLNKLGNIMGITEEALTKIRYR